MAYTSCKDITESTTTELTSERGRARAVELLAASAPDRAFIEALAESMDPIMATQLLTEFDELPASMVSTIVQAWVMAETGGRDFVLRSAKPERPLEFARTSRVRFQIDIEADAVSVTLSHIPGRHATWYQPAALVR
ncbi:MAG: hypothetical protein U0360_09600 [Dehalococcoidia bacterium]